jgi:hypothetical protein
MLKNSVRVFKILISIVCATVLIIIGSISARVKTQLINYKLPKSEEVVDSAIIHFIHGSVPNINCSYQKKRLGGYLGGHIEIEISKKVYGFSYDSLPINYFSKVNFNSKFECREIAEWQTYTLNDKITSIYIPISNQQKEKLQNLLARHFKKEPYDYAFIGQRCASSTAEILSDAKIINNFSNNEAIITFFYPRMLRLTLLNFAKKNNLKVSLKKGINCVKWE